MSDFVRVAKGSEIPDPGKELIEVEDRLVVLLHVDGRFYCMDDLCTHDGGPLAEGSLCGHHLICPRHGAEFDIRDGRAVTMPATGKTVVHEVKVDGEDVYVKLSE